MIVDMLFRLEKRINKMRIDEYISFEETRLIDHLKGKSRMEQDQIIFDYERKKENGNII